MSTVKKLENGLLLVDGLVVHPDVYAASQVPEPATITCTACKGEYPHETIQGPTNFCPFCRAPSPSASMRSYFSNLLGHRRARTVRRLRTARSFRSVR